MYSFTGETGVISSLQNASAVNEPLPPPRESPVRPAILRRLNNLVNAECVTSAGYLRSTKLNTNLAWGERRAQEASARGAGIQ